MNFTWPWSLTWRKKKSSLYLIRILFYKEPSIVIIFKIITKRKLSSKIVFRPCRKMYFCLVKRNRNKNKSSLTDFLMPKTSDFPLTNRITNKIEWWDVTSRIYSHRILSKETLSLAHFVKAWSNLRTVHLNRQWGQLPPGSNQDGHWLTGSRSDYSLL